MMIDPVERIYAELQEVSGILRSRGELSLELMLDDIHRKSLLLAAASFFEIKLSEDIQSFCNDLGGPDSPIAGIVASKAIKRQYHTWFDWDKPNANKFFSMFGSGFKIWMEAVQRGDAQFSQSISDFMTIGSDRNRLVHQNFGSFALESSATDIIDRYRRARLFVESIKEHLTAYWRHVNSRRWPSLDAVAH